MDASNPTSNRNMFERFPELPTDRLHLRRIVASDAEAIFRIWSDERVAGCTDVETFTSPTQAADLIAWLDAQYTAAKGIRWGIVRKTDDELIGTCGFHCLDAAAARAEIGYELRPEFWRQGIMREALPRILQLGFDTQGFHRIEALTNVENAPSARLLQSLGFREEGIRRQYAHFRGAFHDQRCFALLRTEWPPA